MLRYLNPLVWLRWLGQFVSAWLLSIPWADAPKAIPALILVIVVTVTGFIALTGSGFRSRRVNRQLASAFEVDDFETAELMLRRQIAADPDDPDLRYRLAMARDEQGARDEALAIMRDLVAQLDHAEAARWILTNEYIEQSGAETKRAWNELSLEEQDEYGELLELLHEETPDQIGISDALARYYEGTGRLAKAVPVYVEIADTVPMRGLKAAFLQRQLGREQSATDLAEQTLGVLQERYEEEPTNSQLAVAVANTQIFLKRYPEAIQTLGVAVDRARTPELAAELRQGLAESIARYIEHIEETAAESSNQRGRTLAMLQKALEFAPNNPRVLMLLADQILTSDESEGGDEKLKELRRSLIEGASPGIGHFIRGTSALMKDDVDKAVMHLSMAADMMPGSGAILNNLAVAMTQQQEPDLEKALKLSDQAIQVTEQAAQKSGEPVSPAFYETRGQILFELGEYRRAVPDLERALAVDRLKEKAHESLAVCYRELGDDELSEEHRHAAEELAGESEGEVGGDSGE